MPDVVGMVSPRPSTDRRDVLARMVGAIVRHSDDRVDTYEHGTIGLTAAWTSHGAEAGRQSVRREDGNGVWILTGELAEGDRFEDYDERGIAAVTDLNGWFVGLAVDLRRQRCYLFNDRFGMSRLFIHERVDGIYFATTAAALLAAFPETRAFDEQGVAEYLVADCTLGSSSIFKGITVLPAGSLVVLGSGSCGSADLLQSGRMGTADLSDGRQLQRRTSSAVAGRGPEVAAGQAGRRVSDGGTRFTDADVVPERRAGYLPVLYVRQYVSGYV